MASVVSQLIEEVTAHAQSDSLEDAREICADGTYFLNNLSITEHILSYDVWCLLVSKKKIGKWHTVTMNCKYLVGKTLALV